MEKLNTEDLEQKRGVLFSASIRFFPETQPIKDTAMEKIIENILFDDGKGIGFSYSEISEYYRKKTKGFIITDDYLHKILDNLIENGRIKKSNEPIIYSIIDKVKREKEIEKDSFESKLNSIINRLFINSSLDNSILYEPFLDFLSIVFAKLGEENIKLISNDNDLESIIKSCDIETNIDLIIGRYRKLNRKEFETGVLKFFNDSDPEFDDLKWLLGQNYYISKIIGLDDSDKYLSKELFENSIFYLDTNILIIGLSANHIFHQSFKSFITACEQLNIKLFFTEYSIQEFERWLKKQKEIFLETYDTVPDELKDKVDSVFYDIYLNKLDKDENLNPEDIFNDFVDPITKLRDVYRMTYDNDSWFYINESNEKIIKFAKVLQAKSLQLKKKEKKEGAAIHDSLLLHWVNEKRKSHELTKLVTADNSLALIIVPGTDVKLAITLDAILQWMYPYITYTEGGENFSKVFSRIIKYRLLPRERYFVLSDFMIFKKMNIDTKEMAASDVEEGIKYLQKHSSSLDPNKAEDREKMAYELRKFYELKGIKYNEEISRLNILHKETSEKLNEKISELENANKKIIDLETSNERLSAEIKDTKENLTKSDSRINDLSKSVDSLINSIGQKDKEIAKEKLLNSGKLRLIVFFIIYILILLGLTLYIQFIWYADPTKNLLINIGECWKAYGITTLVCFVIGGFAIGKERLKLLGLARMFWRN